MDSIVLDSSRTLRVAQAEARAVIVRFLRAHEFVVTAEQVSMVAAKRGSQIVGSVQTKKLPVVFRANFIPDPRGCVVTIHIGDAWRSGVGKVWGMNGPYRTLMGDISRDLDDVLGPLALDGDGFTAPVMTAATRDVPLLSHANAGVVHGGGAVADKVDQLLTPASAHATPKKLEEVVLRSSKGVASFDRMGVEGLLTVGLLVSTKPGAMPVNLSRDVEAFSARLERLVADQPQGRLSCDVTDDEIPVAEFLTKQAAIRERLPLRTLHVCTTCKLERVVNPDYEKLREKNRRKQVLTGAVGATVSTRGISPFLLVGSLMKFKNFDIPFVCARCQGLEADSSIVTYCPQCGERRDEAVLRSCRRCAYNFVAAERVELWGPEPPESPRLDPPLLAPPRLAPPTPGALPSPAAVFSAPTIPSPNQPGAAPGWYPDSTRRHQHRYWDGSHWTSHVADNGVQTADAV